jgi:NIMA (never in mitosis gene a)-related kinase 1/4/5
MLEINQIIKDYTVLSILGDGTYSTVYKVSKYDSDKNISVTYALKLISLDEFDDKEKENILNEVRILASFSHANIIAYIESFILPPT